MHRRPHPSFATFLPADTERLARGYPNYVELVDGHRHDKKPASWVVKHAGGVDPVYGVEWPREVARIYAHTFPTHPGFDDRGACAAIHADFVAQLGVAGLPTAETLARRLDLAMPGQQTYSSWKIPPALYIHEVLLGAETTACEIVRRLGRYTKREWAMAELDEHTRLALAAIGWMCVRADAAARDRIIAELATVLAKRPPGQLLTRYAALLPDHDCAADEISKDPRPWFMDALSRDGIARRAAAERALGNATPAVDMQYFFLEGCDVLMRCERFVFTYLPKAVALRYLALVGMIRHPGAVRFIAHLGGLHVMREAVKAWVDAHADYVAAVLPELAFDPAVPNHLARCGALPGSARTTVKTKRR